MFKFGGEKIKPVDPEFEEQKERAEYDNREENEKYLANKFSEVLSQNPIVVYMQPPYSNVEDTGIKFDKVEKVGTNGPRRLYWMGIEFNDKNHIQINKEGQVWASGLLDQGNDYKITEESFHNILDMMDKLITISDYTEIEKNSMLRHVVHFLENKIIKKEDLEKIKK